MIDPVGSRTPLPPIPQDGDDDLYNFLSLDMSLQDLTLYFATFFSL
jgi:hypothetical protein